MADPQDAKGTGTSLRLAHREAHTLSGVPTNDDATKEIMPSSSIAKADEALKGLTVQDIQNGVVSNVTREFQYHILNYCRRKLAKRQKIWRHTSSGLHNQYHVMVLALICRLAQDYALTRVTR
jgi:hypothetical protein